MKFRVPRLIFILFLLGIGLVTAPWLASAQDEGIDLIDQPAMGEGGVAAFSVQKSIQAQGTVGADLSSDVTIAVASDLHVRDANLKANRRLVEAVNRLPQVSFVAITGDLCDKIGTEEEYQRLEKLLAGFEDPLLAVPGNHDFMYRDYFNKNGDKIRGTPEGKRAKLERFCKALKLKSVRYARKMGGHLLVFLPTDELDSKPLTELSEATMKFFRETLAANPKMPTIVFCHAPLAKSYERETNLGVLQPENRIRELLKDNPQVFLWVAGHLHIRAGQKDFHSDANKVGNVTGIHVSAVTGDTPWIRVLKLTPEAAVVRTYNVETKKFIPAYERTFKHRESSGTTPGGSESPKTDDGLKSLQNRIDALFEKLEQLYDKTCKLLKKLFDL
ncbi:MAG TPA: metallophosphoesterase [Candidatus Ozemobacteraceae bacterium]